MCVCSAWKFEINPLSHEVLLCDLVIALLQMIVDSNLRWILVLVTRIY